MLIETLSKLCKQSFRIVPFFAFALLNLGATRSDATTYVGSHAVGGGSVHISLTTDGATGYLRASDVTAFDVVVKDSQGSADINNNNGSLGLYFENCCQGLFVSGHDLYDGIADSPVGGDSVLFQQGSLGSGNPFYCLQGNVCFGNTYTYSEEGLNSQPSSGPYYSGGSPSETQVAASGDIYLGTSVPEPSAWSLLIAGLAVVGLSFRAKLAQRSILS